MKNSSATALNPEKRLSRKAQKRKRGHSLQEGMDVKLIPAIRGKNDPKFGTVMLYTEGTREKRDEIIVTLTEHKKGPSAAHTMQLAYVREQSVWKEVVNDPKRLGNKIYAEGHPGYRIKKAA